MDNVKASWREKPYTIPEGKVLEIALIDSKPNYCIIFNKGLNQLYVSRFSRCSATDFDFSVPAQANRQWGWAGTFTTLFVLNPGPGSVDILLTTYEAGFDPNSVAQTGNSVVVANDLNIASMPGVVIQNASLPVTGSMDITGTVAIDNKPGGTLNVGGTVTVGNTALNVQNTSGGTLNVAGEVTVGNTPSVNIANTVNANITSGTVNAVIQNATLNAAVTNVILNKPIPNQAIYFSIPLEFLTDNEIIAPDVTKNILELHVDIRNDGTSGSQRVPQNMGKQINGRHLANPTVGFGTSVREDLSFGPSGIGLDYGIYASCDIANKVWIEGYAIVNSKS